MRWMGEDEAEVERERAVAGGKRKAGATVRSDELEVRRRLQLQPGLEIRGLAPRQKRTLKLGIVLSQGCEGEGAAAETHLPNAAGSFSCGHLQVDLGTAK